MWFHTKKIRRQVCLEPDLYVATRCHAFRSSCDVALASPIGIAKTTIARKTVQLVRWSSRKAWVVQASVHAHAIEKSSIVHSKKTEPWGVFDFFQMFSKIFQFSLFQCLKDAFVLLTFQFQAYSTFGKQLSFFSAKISGFAFSPTSKRSLQVCVVHIPFPRAARKGQSPMTLHCNCTGAMQRGRQQKPRYVLVQKRIPELFFFVKADVLFWKRSSFVYLEESVRVPSFVPSPLRHRCRSWRLMFLKSVSRLLDYLTLKNDSHEAWKWSVTRKKYFERPHTAVFRRQRLGTTPSTQIFKQDDRFGAKRRRLLLWSVREHLIRVVQRSAFVSTDKLWLSRLSFFGMDYRTCNRTPGTWPKSAVRSKKEAEKVESIEGTTVLLGGFVFCLGFEC